MLDGMFMGDYLFSSLIIPFFSDYSLHTNSSEMERAHQVGHRHLNIQPGPANCLSPSYTRFCAVCLCLIAFNLLQLPFAVTRVSGSIILDNRLVEPILRRVIRSPANTRMPGRVAGYVGERSIQV